MIITKEVLHNLIDDIKRATGCESVILAISFEQVPCQKEIDNQPCAGHKFGVASDGIRKDHLKNILIGLTFQVDQMVRQPPPQPLPPEGTVPSPFYPLT